MARRRLRSVNVSSLVELHLPKVQTALMKALVQTQKTLNHDTVRLPHSELETLATLLVEFAVDLHCGNRLWLSLEHYHRDFFGTPLPFLAEPGTSLPPHAILPARIQHFLWVMYPQFLENLLLSPDHADLSRVAEVAAEVLQSQFARLPRESGLKTLLRAPNQYGWDIKKKLIWLGTRSYLFRLFFQRYVEEQGAKPSNAPIPVIDDFVCQNCTRWAGLGVVEILAGVLNLSPERRADLLAWSQRHSAMFKVLSGDNEQIEVLNLFSDARYRIRMNLPSNPFRPGLFVFGSVVPWQGEWYWSGQQSTYPTLSGAELDKLKEGIRMKPNLYYRYAEEDLKRARTIVREQYDEFQSRHGKDWVVFPDGRAMGADWQKAAQEKFESLPVHEQKEFLKKQGLKKYPPAINLPRELMEEKDGIGVYFNPDEGQEIIPRIKVLISGLEKKGVDLTEAEVDAIRDLVQGEPISPGFVRRLAEEFGSESIKSAFLLARRQEPYTLEYLLRRYKGHFYRPRYPTLTLVK